MTKSKTIAAALAALTLATTFTAIGGEAQARPRFGAGLGIGLAAGTLIGVAAASNSYLCRARLPRMPLCRARRPLGQPAHHQGLRRRPY